MQIIKIIIYFSIYVLLLLKCEFPTESEPWIEEKYSFCMVDTDGKNFKILKEEGWSSGSLYFISDDTEILILSSDSFHQMDFDSNYVRYIYTIPLKNIADKKFSPDRKSIIFVASNEEGRDLYSVNIDGSNLKRLTYSPNFSESSPSFSHDGKKIVFITYLWSDHNAKEQTITILDLESNTQVDVLHEKETESISYTHYQYGYPCFNFNDNKIIYIKNNRSLSGGDSLFSINIDGTNNKLFDALASRVSPISMSNQSNRLVYLRYNNTYRIVSMNDDGSDMIEIDNLAWGNCEYEIANDGKKVLIWNRQSDQNLLYIVDSDGTNKKKLASAIQASFSVDNTKVAYVGYNKIVHLLR